jgi:hypothetical protein
MSPLDARAAVLRHLPVLALVRGSPADLDAWLGIPEGTTEQVQREGAGSGPAPSESKGLAGIGGEHEI